MYVNYSIIAFYITSLPVLKANYVTKKCCFKLYIDWVS